MRTARRTAAPTSTSRRPPAKPSLIPLPSPPGPSRPGVFVVPSCPLRPKSHPSRLSHQSPKTQKITSLNWPFNLPRSLAIPLQNGGPASSGPQPRQSAAVRKACLWSVPLVPSGLGPDEAGPIAATVFLNSLSCYPGALLLGEESPTISSSVKASASDSGNSSSSCARPTRIVLVVRRRIDRSSKSVMFLM